MMRLDKFLGETGFGTRSEVKNLIKKGCVTLNGEIAKRPEQKVDESRDVIVCQGRTASYVKYEYLMLHKPAGVLSATRNRWQKTVLDFVTDAKRDDLFPVGRLDKDTEGLLLLTNDGELAHELLSPGKHVDKQYFARVRGQVTGEHVRRFAEGLDIGDEKPAAPARLEILRSGPVSEVLVTIQEGRFHQVKRMFEAVDCEVVYLKRLSMGPLILDESLKPGECRHLTEDELRVLKRSKGEGKKAIGTVRENEVEK